MQSVQRIMGIKATESWDCTAACSKRSRDHTWSNCNNTIIDDLKYNSVSKQWNGPRTHLSRLRTKESLQGWGPDLKLSKVDQDRRVKNRSTPRILEEFGWRLHNRRIWFAWISRCYVIDGWWDEKVQALTTTTRKTNAVSLDYPEFDEILHGSKCSNLRQLLKIKLGIRILSVPTLKNTWRTQLIQALRWTSHTCIQPKMKTSRGLALSKIKKYESTTKDGAKLDRSQVLLWPGGRQGWLRSILL
jgi:hypothetical protein